MDISIDKELSGLSFVSLFPGFICEIIIYIGLVIILYPDIDNISQYLIDSPFISSISLSISAFVIGVSIQGFRYVGLNSNQHFKNIILKNNANGLRKEQSKYAWKAKIVIIKIRMLHFMYKIFNLKNKDKMKKKINIYKNEFYKYNKLRRCKRFYCTIQRFLFYLFREGTCIEECRDNIKENYTPEKIKEYFPKMQKKIARKSNRNFYAWIQNSFKTNGHPEKDLFLYANQINTERPQDNVFQFFNTCELFQNLDTIFFICPFITLFISVIYIVFFRLFSIDISNKFLFGISSEPLKVLPLQNILCQILYLSVLFLFHKIFKSISKSYANRFLKKIDDSLISLENEKRIKLV
jgi:hypothetical protein